MFYKAMSVFVKKHYGSKQAGLFSFFIHIAIFSRAALAAGSRLLKRFTSKVNPQKKRVTPGQTNLILIAGSEDEFENVKKLASEPLAKNKFFQRIETDNVIEEIEEISTSKNVEVAILCEGKLSFQKIIESLPRLPKNIDLKIFSAGSHSIIGGNE
jgi:hypothetical protein